MIEKLGSFAVSLIGFSSTLAMLHSLILFLPVFYLWGAMFTFVFHDQLVRINVLKTKHEAKSMFLNIWLIIRLIDLIG